MISASELWFPKTFCDLVSLSPVISGKHVILGNCDCILRENKFWLVGSRDLGMAAPHKQPEKTCFNHFWLPLGPGPPFPSIIPGQEADEGKWSPEVL